MIYDPEGNLVSIKLANGKIETVKEMGNIIIHLSKTGKPILIEILDASSFIGQFEKLKDIKDIKKIVPNV